MPKYDNTWMKDVGNNIARLALETPPGEPWKDWDVPRQRIAMMDEDEALKQAGFVLGALYLEYLPKRYGVGGYEDKLMELLDEVSRHLGTIQIQRHYRRLIEKHQRDMDLYEQEEERSGGGGSESQSLNDGQDGNP